MEKASMSSGAGDAQAIADLYQRAAQELLLAYQRNKEATRHHASGAFRAALHHARLSCGHSSAAHACLAEVLEKSAPSSGLEWADGQRQPIVSGGFKAH